jgi:hypothetical protein
MTQQNSSFDPSAGAGQSAGAGKPSEAPRIHVDSDWKREAQAEKERMARQVEEDAAKAKRAAAGGGAASGMGGASGHGAAAFSGQASLGGEGPEMVRGVPAASFESLLEMLATQAAIFMSDQHDPETGQALQNLDLAKHYIDLLAVLEEKTKGNLGEPERRMLDTLLYELRMGYVNAAS